MVLASAGSGKTYQLGNRIIGFIAMGIDPATIVALTFTRKAAGEFTDAVLSKIAEAGLDETKAAAIRADLAKSGRALGDVDFISILESFVRALPHMTLGTMDGFFTKIVKAFPHELGISSGTFQLIEGAQAETMQENLLQSILQNELSAEEAQSFYEAFRKSLMGRESFTVRSRLSEYAALWHKEWRSGADALAWGPDALAGGGTVIEWNQQRLAFQEKLLGAADSIAFTHGSQKKSWTTLCENLGSHSTGSGIIAKGGTLLGKIIDSLEQGEKDSITVKLYKDFTIPFQVVQVLSDCLLCAAKAEMANACESTQAVRDVIALYDDVCQRRLRQKGLFRFDDVKVLMGSWSQQEDQRLMREALDFRLHSQYGHWLLDEFQDTSRTDWAGLFPLIDEAATDDEGSLFIVGDKKQAIYGWRGGDVRLFDEIRERYQDRFAIETMPESYRSASEVLDLVNRVCGNQNTIARMYPTAATRWEWQDHTAARVNLRGHTRVETVDCQDDGDARLVRMAALMREIGIGTKSLSCGVLVRTNQEMLDVADFLREEGFRVIEDGIRKPAQDNPLGVALHQLLRWLADPADTFAAETLTMSPLWPQLLNLHADDPWSHAHRMAHEIGFAGLTESLLNPHWDQLSAFGKNRVLDVLQALRSIDQSPGASAKSAAECLEKLTVNQSPGAAHIQVMTIHKAKGLGFDVVFLPLISQENIPNAGNFDIARSEHWICKTPPQWVRQLLPPLRHAEHEWTAQQQYEAMCLLYVALTRAKQGLYVLLDRKAPKDDNNSFSAWISDSCPGDGEVIYESGSIDCYAAIATREAPVLTQRPSLGPAILRQRSATASHRTSLPNRSKQAIDYGIETHALFEKISWLDDENAADLSSYPNSLRKALQQAEVAALLSKNNRNIELLREVPIEGRVDDQWLRGVMDRLHLHRDADHNLIRIDIIDYKTDQDDDPTALQSRHAKQLNAYRTLCAKAFNIPYRSIHCYLIATHRGSVIEIGASHNA